MTGIEFFGGAGEVTGSCFRIGTGGADFLVDCGMFQGGRDAAERNAAALDFDLRALAFVVLTHAHIDHSGLLPRLWARGYRGPVYATPATLDLLGVMLPDSAHIQEMDARRAREHSAGALAAAAPLYTVADAESCLALLRPVAYDRWCEPIDGVQLRFRDAGHILGAAIVECNIALAAGVRRIVFSGDLGQPGQPVMQDPTPIEEADVLLVESTYGNRMHRTLRETYDEIARVLTATLPRGNVVIPSFAVGRTQEILHVLADLVRQGRVPDLTIFVDSPLAARATAITARYAATLDRESRELAQWLARNGARVRVRFTATPQESMALNSITRGAVILAASGMCEGGRIRHHLRHNLPRTECAVVFTGFQAQGTLGRQIVDGAASVHLFREDVPVRATVHTVGGLSAHADQGALLAWLRAYRSPPAHVFVVHGEATTAQVFADLVRTQLGWPDVRVPARGDHFAFD